LNIGPKPDGSIREEELIRLREIGKFMKVNGEAIYGSERSPKNFFESVSMYKTKLVEIIDNVFKYSKFKKEFY